MLEPPGNLASRFERAAVAAGATRQCRPIFDELVDRYGEAHRHYHTLTHIDACLSWLDWFWAFAERPEVVELALWFHDAVYDPESSENERDSAALAREQLGELGIAPGTADIVARHIEATKAHVPVGSDSALVLDLDLSILGARRSAFERFEAQIRTEYAHVPEPAFCEGRRRVLESFLGRPRIYQVAPIREELEARARGNLARRIAELTGDQVSLSVSS